MVSNLFKRVKFVYRKKMAGAELRASLQATEGAHRGGGLDSSHLT